MSNFSKIKWFMDQDDVEILCTNHNIINITGMIGSGKTIHADKYRNDDNYVVISLDCLYRDQDAEHMNAETEKINKILIKKFPGKDKEEHFEEYYKEILEYISKRNKKITFVLEGQHIYRYLDIKDIKGKLIVKRTSIIKCLKRSIIRNIKRDKIQLDNNKITRCEYYQEMCYWIRRRTKQLKHYKELNNFLFRLKVVNTQNKN